LNGKRLVIGLAMVFAALITIAAFYALMVGAFAKVNIAGAVAAVSVAVAGIVWFRKTVDSHK